MAYLDRFLAAMVTSRADALTLAADDIARMSIANVPRPVTKQPLRAAQLRSVLLEVAPADARDALSAGTDVSFGYTFENAVYDIRVAVMPQKNLYETPTSKRRPYSSQVSTWRGSPFW